MVNVPSVGAAMLHRPSSRKITMRRTFLLSGLYMLAIAFLALPYGLVA